MHDDFVQQGKRRRLVEEIKRKGIKNIDILNAIGRVPRHLFMGKSFVNFAYKDTAFPIGEKQTISQPYTVAYQTELLNCKTGEKVLEIGTGSGYQAAILAELGVDLYTIERQEKLYINSKKLLNSLGYNVKVIFGDGHKGASEFAPFDKILITAAALEIPEDLLFQLKIGGYMIVPLGKDVQTMTKITREGEEEFAKKTFGKFSFVPMLGGVVKKK